ncbi:hypothetical protein FHW92_003424 [Novosphingobium sp. SG707]|nr:hypothetical protein [Novosphingobium sp. SG707]
MTIECTDECTRSEMIRVPFTSAYALNETALIPAPH